MRTWPNYAVMSDEDLRKEYWENAHWYKYYYDIGWHDKASGFYDLATLAAREMTRRKQAKRED